MTRTQLMKSHLHGSNDTKEMSKDKIQMHPEFGDTNYYANCSVCDKGTDSGGGAWDEGHIWTCKECIADWEKENQAHWETGRPFI